MKFCMDRSPFTFQLLDDNGNKVEAPISGVDIRIRPNDCRATLHVDFPELDLELNTNDLTLKRTCRLVIARGSQGHGSE